MSLPEEEVTQIIQEMIQEGILKGHISDDGTRFFRQIDSLISSIHHEEIPLEFMEYDSRPGIAAALVGFVAIIVVSILRPFLLGSGRYELELVFYYTLLMGMTTILFGCYYVGRKPTP
ncbi:MAG: hypothetical protein K9W43_10715 [Candidatus Thorarchaeota archaeon]|nr:hypothetical protein [Candidatus Thorarchaeota archaeon]